MFALELLGTVSLRCDTHPVSVAARQKRPSGLMAVLALGARQGLSRDRIEAFLWPESSGASARHVLDQTVYAIRHALGSDLLLSSGPDPLSARATKKLMLTLAVAGDRAGAVKQARVYQQLIRQELEMEPDSEIESLASTYSHPALAETAAATRLEASTVAPAPVGEIAT